PRRHLTRRRQFQNADAADVFVVLDFGDGVFGGEAVEVEDADGGAAGGGAADGHLGDVDPVVAKDGPDRADDAGDVVVGEDEHHPVQVGFQAEVRQADQ